MTMLAFTSAHNNDAIIGRQSLACLFFQVRELIRPRQFVYLRLSDLSLYVLLVDALGFITRALTSPDLILGKR